MSCSVEAGQVKGSSLAVCIPVQASAKAVFLFGDSQAIVISDSGRFLLPSQLGHQTSVFLGLFSSPPGQLSILLTETLSGRREQ